MSGIPAFRTVSRTVLSAHEIGHLCTHSPTLCCNDGESPILRPRQNGSHFPYDIFKYIFVNENVQILIKISLKLVRKGLVNNIPALVQIMAWRRPGDKTSEPMMVQHEFRLHVRPYCNETTHKQEVNICLFNTPRPRQNGLTLLSQDLVLLINHSLSKIANNWPQSQTSEKQLYSCMTIWSGLVGKHIVVIIIENCFLVIGKLSERQSHKYEKCFRFCHLMTKEWINSNPSQENTAHPGHWNIAQNWGKHSPKYMNV